MLEKFNIIKVIIMTMTYLSFSSFLPRYDDISRTDLVWVVLVRGSWDLEQNRRFIRISVKYITIELTILIRVYVDGT